MGHAKPRVPLHTVAAALTQRHISSHSLETCPKYTEIRTSRGGKRHELQLCVEPAPACLIPEFFASFDANRQVPDLIAPDGILYPGSEALIIDEKRSRRISLIPFDLHLIFHQKIHCSRCFIVTSGHTRRKDGQHCTYYPGKASLLTLVLAYSFLAPVVVTEAEGGSTSYSSAPSLCGSWLTHLLA